jgi:hypothetical protein
MSAIGRNQMKNWEVVADNLSKAGFSLGWVSAIDLERRTIWIVDAHHGDEKRYVVGERARFEPVAWCTTKVLWAARQRVLSIAPVFPQNDAHDFFQFRRIFESLGRQIS